MSPSPRKVGPPGSEGFAGISSERKMQALFGRVEENAVRALKREEEIPSADFVEIVGLVIEAGRRPPIHPILETKERYTRRFVAGGEDFDSLFTAHLCVGVFEGTRDLGKPFLDVSWGRGRKTSYQKLEGLEKKGNRLVSVSGNRKPSSGRRAVFFRDGNKIPGEIYPLVLDGLKRASGTKK